MQPEPRRFFDGGSLDGRELPDPAQPMRVLLERVVEPKARRFLWFCWTTPSQEQFKLQRRIAYQARRFGQPIVVPVGRDFRSDLTSVPTLFSWLVPRTGCHLPAALLHDGLVHDPNEPKSYDGPELTLTDADRVFRDAMGDLGTAVVRRGLVWTAVTLATVVAGARPTRLGSSYYRVAVFGSFALIAGLGVLATLGPVRRVERAALDGPAAAVA